MPVDPRAFAGIALMGGPMSVNDSLPWHRAASPRCCARRSTDDVPVLGHCLGGQLFAQALGAPVTRAPVTEIGWLDVDVCDDAAQREWFGGRAAFTTFEWHYDAFALPAGATPVLTNAFNAHQAYVVGGRHIGFQCHIEMTEALVETWLESGANELPAAVDARHAERRRHPPRPRLRASQRCIASRTTSTRAGRKDSRASGSRFRRRPSAADATGAAPGRAGRRRRSR